MKKLIVIIVSFISVSIGYSQDAHFSQYNHSRLNVNPAFTGCDSMLVISGHYRLQWPGSSSVYKATHFSMDKYFHAIKGGIGLSYLSDNQMNGTYIKTRMDLSYAAHFELFNHKLVLKPGIQIGYFQNSIDWSKLTFGDMIDERRGFVYSTNEVHPGVSKKSNIDLSMGLLLYSKTFFGGIAVHHLTQPDEGLIGPSKLPMKLTIHGGANLKFRKDSIGKFILSPTLLFMQQQDFQMLMPGITAKYRFISLGISYRNKDAFVTTIALQFKNFRLGYSYDYTVSTLDNDNTGRAHEIGLSGFLKFKRKNHCKIRTLRLI
ncbi:MAG: PorP/SprF family type IX secretion system membrane protein [Bacteroidetes bacterium]|nr:PorP/SprF family type IX secretion system membrane protein [Bacteroidota bacterium]